MKNIFVFAISILLSLNTFSQQNVRKKYIYFKSISQFGLLNGEGGVSYNLQTINGIGIRKWSVGVGVGIDNYISRSVPLFLDGRKEFGNRQNVPFVYGNAGVNFTWLSFVQKEQKGVPYSTRPGAYLGAGVGVRLKGKNNRGAVLSIGYSYKQSLEEVSPSVWIMPWPNVVDVERNDRLDSRFRRIVVSIGIQI